MVGTAPVWVFIWFVVCLRFVVVYNWFGFSIELCVLIGLVGSFAYVLLRFDVLVLLIVIKCDLRFVIMFICFILYLFWFCFTLFGLIWFAWLFCGWFGVWFVWFSDFGFDWFWFWVLWVCLPNLLFLLILSFAVWFYLLVFGFVCWLVVNLTPAVDLFCLTFSGLMFASVWVCLFTLYYVWIGFVFNVCVSAICFDFVLVTLFGMFCIETLFGILFSWFLFGFVFYDLFWFLLIWFDIVGYFEF